MTGHRRPRRGYTLIETVLVVGAVSIVIALCATLLGGLLKVERGGRAALVDATSLARLARQFRQDVRASGSAKRLGGGQEGDGIELAGVGKSTVVYQVEGPRLLREERRGDKVRAREAYPADRLGPVAFEVEGRWAALVLARKGREARGAGRPAVRVEARVGKGREPAARAEESK